MYKALDKWLMPYLKRPLPELPEKGVFLFCICDHFEPLHDTDKAGALERVKQWRKVLPPLSRKFAETMGSPLKWTMFYPLEQYDSDILDELAQLCRTGCAEVDVHLHHSDDNADNLADVLLDGKEKFREHGLLYTDELDQTRFSFVHGNWALNNSHPDGLYCGVDNEVQVLVDWGCVADFTMPSAPNPCQTQTVNTLYYAVGDDEGNVDHADGPRVSVNGEEPKNSLLMVQGPLALNKEKKKFGLLPGIENGDLTAANPPTYDRLNLWTGLGISVEGHEDWVVVKLHTHGADPDNTATLLGEPMAQFAEDMARFLEENPDWQAHFVTARELVNIIKAAEKGEDGNPLDYRDYLYKLVTPPEAGAEGTDTDYESLDLEKPAPVKPAVNPFRREGNILYVTPNWNSGSSMYFRRRESE